MSVLSEPDSLSSPPASEWTEMGRVDLMFSHIDQNVSGLAFPEENFVFSDNFRTILRNAGLADLADETNR